MEKVETLTIAEVADSLNKSQQFIRVGLQRDRFPFGVAVPPQDGCKRWNYVIFKKRFYDYIGGIKNEQTNENEIETSLYKRND